MIRNWLFKTSRAMIRWAGVTTLGLSLSGCAHINIHRVSTHPPETQGAPTTYPNYLLGFLERTNPIDLKSVCSGNWEEADSYVTRTQALFRVVTLNLYSPWTVSVNCSSVQKR